MIDTAIQHYHRARASLEDAVRASSREDKERHLASAVENAVAIVECFRGTVPDAKLYDLAGSIRRYRLLADTLRAAGQETQAAQADSERRKIVESWKKKLAGNQSVEAILLR